MTTADSIRKFGFRKWYERQLIASHAYLVACFIAMIVIAAALEGLYLRGPLVPALIKLGVIGGGVALCAIAFRQYQRIMTLAERLAGHATCSQCNYYAALKVIASGPRPSGISEDDLVRETWLKVSCKKCGHEWTI